MESVAVEGVYCPLVAVRNPDLFASWWDGFENKEDVAEFLGGLDGLEPEFALNGLLLELFQSGEGGFPWLQVRGLVAGATPRWVGLDADIAYDGGGVLCGVDVVLSLIVDVLGQPLVQHFSVSSYVSRVRDFVPQADEPGAELAELVDALLALVNFEIGQRDAFSAAARRLRVMATE